MSPLTSYQQDPSLSVSTTGWPSAAVLATAGPAGGIGGVREVMGVQTGQGLGVRTVGFFSFLFFIYF